MKVDTSQLLHILLSDIDIGERFRKDYGDLKQFKYSITKNGLITPIAVGLTESLKINQKGDKKYTLLAGGRRMAAITEMGWMTVPAKVYDQPLTELDYRSIELAENLDRKEMSYVEEISLKKQINDLQIEIHGPKHSKAPDALGWSQADTARLLQETPANLSKDLKLASAMEQFPEIGLDKCKNKSDALKMLNSIGRQLTNSVKSEQFTKEMGTTNKIFKRLYDAYIVGDCFKTLSQMPNNTMDFIEIDPPYAMDLHSKKADSVMLGYNEIEVKEYAEFMVKLFSECYRILRPDSWLVCWFAMDPWFFPISEWLKGTGFKMNTLPGMWLKPNGQTMQPESQFANCYEPFFYCRKGQPKFNKAGRANVFEFTPMPPSQKIHPTQRPLPLMVELFSTFCRPGQQAYIPFLGSGVSLMASHTCQVSSFGNDLTREFKEGYIVQLKSYLETQNVN